MPHPNQPPTTSVTLVGRLRDPADQDAWREFDHRYRDLIVRFLRGRGLQLADAEDSAQGVLTKLVTGLRAFSYDASKGGFRAYLFRCTRSALSDHFERQARGTTPVSNHEGCLRAGSDRSGDADDPAFAEFEREWVDHHYRLAVSRYRATADGRAIALFEAALAGRTARLIGEEHGMSEDAVHKAQQRTRDRLSALIEEQVRDEEVGDHRRAS